MCICVHDHKVIIMSQGVYVLWSGVETIKTQCMKETDVD